MTSANGYNTTMRHLLFGLVAMALLANDAAAARKRRRRPKKPAYAIGQVCTLKRAVRGYLKSGKKLVLKKGERIELFKVGSKWVIVRKGEDTTEISAKLNRGFRRACKATTPAGEPKPKPKPKPKPGPEPKPEPERVAPEPTAAEVEPEPYTPQPEPTPMPIPEPSVYEGGEMELPASPGPKDRSDLSAPPPPLPEKITPFSALDVLGAAAIGPKVERQRSSRFGSVDPLTYSALGAGGAGIIAGGILIGVASGQAGELAEDIEIYNARAVRTTAEAEALADRKREIAMLDGAGIIAGSLGLAAAGIGIYMLFFTEDDESTAWIAPATGEHTGVVIGGRF